MGKKRIITKQDSSRDSSRAEATSGSDILVKKSGRKQVLTGVINVASSYNNTLVNISDPKGSVLVWSSAGSLGFKGARKSTPYAATLVAKDVAEKAKRFGLQDVVVVIRGVGPGREAAIRGIASSGLNITSIIDNTPIPHNGVRPPKPRRV